MFKAAHNSIWFHNLLWYSVVSTPLLRKMQLKRVQSSVLSGLFVSTLWWYHDLETVPVLLSLYDGKSTLHRRIFSLRWRHNEHDSVSNHQRFDCLRNRLLGPRSKKTSKLRVTGLCGENSPVTDKFPAQSAGIAENVSIWWRHRVKKALLGVD